MRRIWRASARPQPGESPPLVGVAPSCIRAAPARTIPHNPMLPESAYLKALFLGLE